MLKTLKRIDLSTVLAGLVLSTLLALGLKLVLANVAPFVALLGGTVVHSSGIPLVGWLVDVMTLAFSSLGALMLWAITQWAECLWLLVLFNRKAHRYAIREQDKERSTSRYDSKEYRRLLRLPFTFIRLSPLVGLGALAFDFIVNVMYYDLVNVPLFLGGLMIGRVMGINGDAFLAMLFNLCSFEVLLVLVVISYQWLKASLEA